MKSFEKACVAIPTKKIDILTLVDDRIILKINKKQETAILFSELKKIHIQKCQLGFLNKITLISVLLFLSVFLINYLPVEIGLITSILYIPLIEKMNTYISYQLHFHLYDGTVFIKNIKKNRKYDYINLVSAVRKEIFENQLKSNINLVKPEIYTIKEEEYGFSALNISNFNCG